MSETVTLTISGVATSRVEEEVITRLVSLIDERITTAINTAMAERIEALSVETFQAQAEVVIRDFLDEGWEVSDGSYSRKIVTIKSAVQEYVNPKRRDHYQKDPVTNLIDQTIQHLLKKEGETVVSDFRKRAKEAMDEKLVAVITEGVKATLSR